MIPQKIIDILNAQIEKEGYSANLYLAMAVWADYSGFPGTANWLYAQAEEEKMHMMKFIEYLNQVGAKVEIPAFKKPANDFSNLKTLFEAVLKHEEYISESINNIVKTCYEENDYRTLSWVQWFVQEQIEEESSVREILDKLNLAGNNFFWFDKELNERNTTEDNA
jgi:ferritin